MANEPVEMKAIAMNLLSPFPRWGAPVKRLIYWALRLPLIDKKLTELLQLSFIHFARWVIVPPSRFVQFPGQPPNRIERDYLYFASNYNGHWDQYIDAFSDVVSDGLDGMWKFCLNWVPASQVVALKRYIMWHEIRHDVIPADHYFCAYPEASTNDVKAALHLMDELRAFREASPANETDEAWDQRYRELLAKVQHCLGSRGRGLTDPDRIAEAAGMPEPIRPPPFTD